MDAKNWHGAQGLQITQGESQLSVVRETLASEQANGQSLLEQGLAEY